MLVFRYLSAVAHEDHIQHWFVLSCTDFMRSEEFDQTLAGVTDWCSDNFEPRIWSLADDEWIIIRDDVAAAAFRLRWC